MQSDMQQLIAVQAFFRAFLALLESIRQRCRLTHRSGLYASCRLVPRMSNVCVTEPQRCAAFDYPFYCSYSKKELSST